MNGEPRTWADRIDDFARAAPHDVALIVAGGRRDVFTWRDLAWRPAGIADLFAERGVQAGSVVCLRLPNGAAIVLATLAAWRLGATVLPLRWDLPASETAELLALANPVLVVAEEGGGDVMTAAQLLAAGRVDPADRPSGPPASPAWMIASGGSTGRPKLIAPANSTRLADVPIIPGTDDGPWTHLVCSPLSHTQGFAGLFSKLVEGVRVVLMPRFDALQFLDLVERDRVNSFALVPTTAIRLLEEPSIDKCDFSSVKAVTLGAGASPDWVVRRLIDLIGADRLRIGYGMSEGIATVLITGREWLDHPGSVGKPVGVETLVADEAGQPQRRGEEGELYFRPIKGRHGFRYLGGTVARSLPGGWISVGDIGRLDADGYLYIVDRRTDMIKTGGANVFASEVEAALLLHVKVADAGVIGLPDPLWGRRVHAIVQLVPGTDPAGLAEQLRSHVKRLLASYKAPHSFEFVETLGRSEMGKLNRQLLLKQRGC